MTVPTTSRPRLIRWKIPFFYRPFVSCLRHFVGVRHGGIRYGALSSQRSHSNAYAVLSPLAATLLMAQTQSIIVTCTGFHVENRVRGDQQNGP